MKLFKSLLQYSTSLSQEEVTDLKEIKEDQNVFIFSLQKIVLMGIVHFFPESRFYFRVVNRLIKYIIHTAFHWQASSVQTLTLH